MSSRWRAIRIAATTSSGSCGTCPTSTARPWHRRAICSGWRDAEKAGRARPDLSTEDTHGPDFRQEAAIPLPSETHGGEDVAIYASGPGAALVHGVMEQHWIFHVMQDAFGFPPAVR
jgi:alkaline phosphatase